ncbi:hypothetical protein [Aquabacterium sp.]|uniref:hypothetical protein n=1 Tax=Aquabacterium sp. TaxID=1872578 RepID=UPI003D6D4CEA
MDTLQTVGLVCVVAALVGGGLKLLGAELPVLSTPRQVILGLFGLVLLAAHAGLFPDTKLGHIEQVPIEPALAASEHVPPPPTPPEHNTQPRSEPKIVPMDITVTAEGADADEACMKGYQRAFTQCYETQGALGAHRQRTEGLCHSEMCGDGAGPCRLDYTYSCLVESK